MGISYGDFAKGAVKGVQKTLSSKVGTPIGSAIFGDSKNAGILGTGQFKTDQHEIDWSAFNDDTAGEARRGKLEKQQADINGRVRPVIDPSHQNQFRNKQMALAADLEARARGEGPSIAEDSLRRTTDRNLAGAMAMANSGVGNPASVARNAGNQLASINQEAAGQASTLRLQEAENARGALGNLLASGRGADIDIAGANLNADLANRGLNDRMTLGLNEQLIGSEGAAADRRMSGQGLGVQQALGVGKINQEAYSDASGRRGDFLGGLAEGATSFAQMMADGGEVEPRSGHHRLGRALGGGGITDAIKKITSKITGEGGAAGMDQDAAGLGGAAMKLAPMFLMANSGAVIPGRASVPGDHPANDTVLVGASPGEIVIPRTIAKSPEASKGFVAGINADKPKKPAADVDFADALSSMITQNSTLIGRIADLEKAFQMDHGRRKSA